MLRPIEGHGVDDVIVTLDVVDGLGSPDVPDDDAVIVAAAQQDVLGRRVPLDDGYAPPRILKLKCQLQTTRSLDLVMILPSSVWPFIWLGS